MCPGPIPPHDAAEHCTYSVLEEQHDKALLLHSGGQAYSNAHFGSGTGQIFLDAVQCSSSSSQLLECHSRPILSHYCDHSEDAGVGCEGTLMLAIIFTYISIYTALYCT